MLNNLNTKINHDRKPSPRPIPGGPVKPQPKPAPGRQDDGPGCIKRPQPRQPQPGDVYIGGPGPKGQQQYDAKDLAKAGATPGHAPKHESVRPGGPFMVDEGFSLQKLQTN